MKASKMLLPSLFLIFGFAVEALPQTSGFDLAAYQQFLQQHQNMNAAELLAMYPAGSFKAEANVPSGTVSYLDVIDNVYHLTDDEKSLIKKHGFLVTERLRKNNFVQQYSDIWAKDLPVFISADAILHAFHYYYVEILQQVEKGALLPQVTNLLAAMHLRLPDLAVKYAGQPAMAQMLKDVDVYLTVPRRLLGENAFPYYPENSATISEILKLINAEKFEVYPFFSAHCKEIDFSQFRPRGHYAEDAALAKYFRAMTWLGRIEIDLLRPQADTLICPPQTSQDIQRQIIDAVLISELMELAGANSLYEEIEKVLSFWVGEQDNVTLPNLRSLIESLNLTDASRLLDTLVVRDFQDALKTKAWAFQRILSQVLASDPLSPEIAVPASVFVLFGQRFVIDSYVTGSVVYDKILYNGNKVCRLFPSTLDNLFAHGNSAAAQLLIPELEQYHYSTNLAALRYLIDSYDDEFWNSSIYSMWLKTIRTLNPPEAKDQLPPFMQTGAWWQQKMNTQLSSWTELRHDHLLYAKQSYTSGQACSYPCGYVEPVPQTFESLRALAEVAHAKFSDLPFNNPQLKSEILGYFKLLLGVTGKLATIAGKELSGTPLDPSESSFIGDMLYWGGCRTLIGWYLKLLLGPSYEGMAYETENFTDHLVADYHTTPTDCNGNMMGWVSHAGTGAVDLAIVVAPDAGGKMIAYAGPVASYHEYVTTNFQRLTDAEWSGTFLASAPRPNWVNLYLADMAGKARGPGGTLLTGVADRDEDKNDRLPTTHVMAQNYPNPFNAGTLIRFTVPYHLTNAFTTLTIYDIEGKKVRRLVEEKLPAGTYLTRWEGTDDLGNKVANGVYLYRLNVGTEQFLGKMNLLK